MQTWIKANIGKLKARMSTAENKIEIAERNIEVLQREQRAQATTISNLQQTVLELEHRLDNLSFDLTTQAKYDRMSSHDSNTLYVIKPTTTENATSKKKVEK